MKPFETYLTFIENSLGIPLCGWQKTVLQAVYEGKHPIYATPGRGGKVAMLKAIEILTEEMARDRGELPSRLYELDGYNTTVVTCDDNWGENIIWEKETDDDK